MQPPNGKDGHNRLSGGNLEGYNCTTLFKFATCVEPIILGGESSLPTPDIISCGGHCSVVVDHLSAVSLTPTRQY